MHILHLEDWLAVFRVWAWSDTFSKGGARLITRLEWRDACGVESVDGCTLG